MKEIDLGPQDWKSERPKPKEPFFGKGAKPFLLKFLCYFTGVLLITLAKQWYWG